jgi:hypothetical protein
MRSIGTALAIFALAALFAASAGAAGLEGLAPPGPCADAELRADPEQGFDVAGGPREHFDARDVAGGGDRPGFDAPDAPSFTPGPCEGPAAGCADGTMPRRGNVVVNEPAPTPGDGPVFSGVTGGRP